MVKSGLLESAFLQKKEKKRKGTSTGTFSSNYVEIPRSRYPGRGQLVLSMGSNPAGHSSTWHPGNQPSRG